MSNSDPIPTHGSDVLQAPFESDTHTAPSLNLFDRLEPHHLVQIRDNLSTSALSALSRTCKSYHTTLTPLLYGHIRITSTEELSRLVFPRLSPILVERTRRITIDCPCTLGFLDLLRKLAPVYRPIYRRPRVVFDRVVSLVFGRTWMASLIDAVHWPAIKTAECLSRVVNPKSICMEYGPRVYLSRIFFEMFLSTMTAQWTLTSLSYHGPVDFLVSQQRMLGSASSRLKVNFFDSSTSSPDDRVHVIAASLGDLDRGEEDRMGVRAHIRGVPVGQKAAEGGSGFGLGSAEGGRRCEACQTQK